MQSYGIKIALRVLMFLLTLSITAQEHPVYKDSYLTELIKTERKGGLKRMLFQRNANTGNYDVKYHRLVWNVNPTQAFISGSVTTYFTANANMSTLTFDMANNLSVSAITQRGTPLTFSTNANDELVITLPTTLTQGSLDSLTVTYSGNPVSSGFGSFEVNTHNGTPVLWTLSEPYGAKGWWPCKQDLVDKIDSIDVFISHPSAYKGVANGLRISEKVNGSTTTTHWKHRYKIPAYLIAIAVTNYSEYSHYVAHGDFDIVNYVYPESLTTAQSQTPVTVDIMNLFNNTFELYPFADEKYGHAQFGWGGGMEHTTVSFMGNFNRDLIAHELAHQWFGNKVTCGSWEDIWLNEGFATYLTGLSIQAIDGATQFNNWKRGNTNSITSSIFGSVHCTDTTSVSRIFNGRLSYRKGAMLLHMLSYTLGNQVFLTGVKNYLQDANLAYGYAKTNDLKQHLEAASGKDLTEFFNDWYYGEGFPSYQNTISVYGNEVRITVNQTQAHPSVAFYEMPLTYKIIGTGGEEEYVRFDHTSNGQEFSHSGAFPIADVIFDPDFDIVSTNNSRTLSIENEFLAKDLTISPNPFSDQLTIQSKTGLQITKIALYNALGQKVYEPLHITETIALPKLSKGLYVLKVSTNRGVVTKTLLK